MSALKSKLRLPRIELPAAMDGKVEHDPVVTYYLIVVPALVLTTFGLVMGFSASAVTNIAAGNSPYLAFVRQLFIVIVSLVLALIVHFGPHKWWYKHAPAAFLASLALQSLVLTPLGVNVGGNTNWIAIPGLPQMQPSELIKLTLILLLARMLARPGARREDWKQMGVTVGIPIAVGIGAVLLGKDMGTAMVVAVAALAALWVAGLPGRWFLGLIAFAVPVGAFLVASNPTRLRRILAVLPWNGEERDLSSPEQIDHALWALGSGGISGLGPGASREKWNYLQEGHTDFILAILGEEFGLLGTLTVLLCLGLLSWSMVRVALSATNDFVAISAAGIAAWIGAQGIINITSVTGLGPVIGVPLPLVSYGGSSFLFTAFAIAVVASFARAEAGMWTFGSPDESSAGRDPRVAPRKRRPGRRQARSKKKVREEV
ncbi:MAG: FtsW/RodA/SpoVE family cell cycle protein [Actinomycetaceae bacterium]|nr:FtsW/RodA/SpoVE family cell cycle protein [Actinomycetaceae bacterium]